MLALLTICLVIGAVAGLVLVFVAYPYRGRALPVVEPLGDAVAAVADRIDPGEAPPQGVLGSPEAARRTRRRIEVAESRLTQRLRELSASVTGGRAPVEPAVPAAAEAATERSVERPTDRPMQPAADGPDERPRRTPEEIDLRQHLLEPGPRHSRR